MNRLISLLVPVAILAGIPIDAPAGGLSDRLLLSSAWCSFSYNKVSGTTKTTRAQFHANGTFSMGNQRESQSSGQYGSVYGQGGSSGGRWQVRAGELYMGEDGGPLEAVETVLKRNSNGYHIIVADGIEYMQCG